MGCGGEDREGVSCLSGVWVAYEQGNQSSELDPAVLNVVTVTCFHFLPTLQFVISSRALYFCSMLP